MTTRPLKKIGVDCSTDSNKVGVAVGVLRSDKPGTGDRPKQATIGDPIALNGPIVLAESNPAWPEQFARQAKRIQAALGERALRIEHVGSTSVPGLAAKPVLDILLVVADSADEPSYVPALEAAGFVLHIREPEWHEHRLFKGSEIHLNLHVFSAGSAEIERLLVLRDRLRENPVERQLYEQTKRELAGRTWKYVQDYADAKSEVIEGIISRARAQVIPGRASVDR
jgi:GrpB-like predicted nucleotidyltransferase (UPF0157 family)